VLQVRNDLFLELDTGMDGRDANAQKEVGMRKQLLGTVLMLSVILGNGLSAGGPKKKPKASEELSAPTTTKVSAKLPTFAPLAETNPTQEKGGLTITIAPAEYHTTALFLSSDRRVFATLKERLLAPVDITRNMLVEKIFTPVPEIVPDTLGFRVHVSNQMPRVFRAAGIVVQFNVAGKVVQYDPSGTTELVQAIIPPRSEQFMDIHGAKISDIPERCTIGVFFYDVVTKLDTAGNVIEKQNFEWYFQYATKLVEEEVAVPPPKRVWVPL